ncbi:MAG: STAS domain-containing protein [Ignavibacteriaceae bacterium]
MNNPHDFVTETVNDIFIVTIKIKRATIDEAGDLNKILSDAIVNGRTKFLIEMHDVEYIDSTFLGALVINLKKTYELNGKFGLVGFKASLHTFLQQMSLDRTFEMYVSREEALNNI